jgi:hypothetical protein
MKKIIIYFAALIIGFSAFTSCEDTNEEIIFSDSDKFIAFEKGSVEAKEEGSMIGIPVYIAGTKSGDGATVNFAFDTTGIDNPAIEGVDYTLINDDLSLSWDNYFGYDTIWIEPIDNDVYDKDKFVNIVLSNPTNNYNLGALSVASLKIADNEHPLSLVIGDYTITYGSGFTGDFGTEYTVDITTRPNPENETQIVIRTMELFPGWGFTEDDVIYANIDLDAMTINIAAGQDAPSYGYGPSKFTGYDADTDIQFEDGEMISGTIDANGDIHIPHFTGQQITSGSNEGLWFDLWAYSDWAKTSAKNMNYVEISHNRQPRSK